MNKIKNIEHFNNLVLESKGKRKSSNINCYLLANDIMELTNKGCLFYEEDPAGMLIFCEKYEYYMLYIYSNPHMSFSIIPKDKPIVTEFSGMMSLPHKSLSVIEKLKESKFMNSITSHRMTVNTHDFKNKMCLDEIEDMGYRIVHAQMDHLTEIISIWEKSFDPIVNLLPSESELADIIKDGILLCAVTPENKIMGVLQVGIESGCGLIRHEAVLPEYRNKNVGTALSSYFSEIVCQKGIKRNNLWVIGNDIKAINFHRKFGFHFDGRISEQYILKSMVAGSCNQ